MNHKERKEHKEAGEKDGAKNGVRIICGESLAIMREMPSGSFDAVACDPPYSSGGQFRGDRMQATSDKYQLNGTAKTYPEFYGDTRDQRGLLAWSVLWMEQCYRLLRDGGVLMSFTDWRNSAVFSDAMQCAGFVWRGRVRWDKTEAARPNKGWFRTGQDEDILLGTKGAWTPKTDVCLAGVWRGSVMSGGEKFHMTGKPVELMKWLMQILPRDSDILDPFCGGGSTLVAAAETGRRATGIELSAEYCEIIRNRLAALQPELM